MALPTLDATFASSADLPRRQMLAKWLVEELGEAQAPSNVLVSGLADTQYNGLYVYDDDLNGRSSYKLGAYIVFWTNSNWALEGDNGVRVSSDSDVAYPWLATGWYDEGIDPTGLVITESPAPSPLSNYYSLPERYLWAKIAVAAGAPRGEAAYISLPKNYAWSDIYNAVSGDIANSTVVISDAGTEAINGEYIRNGLYGGKPYYLYAGNSLEWSVGDAWWSIVDGSTGDVVYASNDNTTHPWQVTTWFAFNDGIPPAPTLTPQTPNHTDWTEKQALGHIAAAYRGDTENPEALATYIDWPWRYQVASIIDATSVCSDADAGVLINGNFLYKIADKYYSNGTYEITYGSGQWFYEESGVATLDVVTSSEEYPWLAGLGEKDCFARFSNLPNAVIVSGAGTSSSDGTYVFSSVLFSRPAYTLNSNTISWDGGVWYLYDDSLITNTYASQSDVLFPWDGTWVVEDADGPPPTLTATTI